MLYISFNDGSENLIVHQENAPLLMICYLFVTCVKVMKKEYINTLFFFTDDDSRVKLYKGKNDYINANYVSVSNT